MTIDPSTLKTLQYHGRRMNFAIAQGNHAEAERIQNRVDSILDERPKAVGTAEDGEVIYDNGSPWVQAQVTTAVNATEKSEPVLTPQQWYGFLEEPDEGPDSPNGGGVGLLDRP